MTPSSAVHELLDAVKACCEVLPISLAMHERALNLAERYPLSFYDALICSAALGADVKTLYSEDMQDGLVIGSLTIENPFRQSGASAN